MIAGGKRSGESYRVTGHMLCGAGGASQLCSSKVGTASLALLELEMTWRCSPSVDNRYMLFLEVSIGVTQYDRKYLTMIHLPLLLRMRLSRCLAFSLS